MGVLSLNFLKKVIYIKPSAVSLWRLLNLVSVDNLLTEPGVLGFLLLLQLVEC